MKIRSETEIMASVTISELRQLLLAMTDEQRVKAFEEVEEGYCRHCGRCESEKEMYCQCQNDE